MPLGGRGARRGKRETWGEGRGAQGSELDEAPLLRLRFFEPEPMSGVPELGSRRPESNPVADIEGQLFLHIRALRASSGAPLGPRASTGRTPNGVAGVAATSHGLAAANGLAPANGLAATIGIATARGTDATMKIAATHGIADGIATTPQPVRLPKIGSPQPMDVIDAAHDAATTHEIASLSRALHPGLPAPLSATSRA